MDRPSTPVAVFESLPPTSTFNGEGYAPSMLQTFTLFPRLPTEVKFMIWQQVAKAPRLVEVRVCKNQHNKSHSFHSDVPAILQIDKETRAELLNKTYSFDLVTKRSLNKVYFNFEVDILYLRDGAQYAEELWKNLEYFISQLPGKDRIRNVGIDTTYLIDSHSLEPDNPMWIACTPIFKFPSLAQLFGVTGQSSQFWGYGDPELKIHCCCVSTWSEKRPQHPILLCDKDLDRHLRHEFARRPITVPRVNENNVFRKLILCAEFAKEEHIRWKMPEFAWSGVIHDHMANYQPWCNPYSNKVHHTRSKTIKAPVHKPFVNERRRSSHFKRTYNSPTGTQSPRCCSRSYSPVSSRSSSFSAT